MYNEELLRARIATQTGYTTELSLESNIDLTEETLTVPKVFVGHIGIRLKEPGFLWADGYSEVENRQIILSNIQILCERSSLTTVRNAVRAAYKDYSPIANSEYSSIIFIEASVAAVTKNKIWWIEQVGVVFPGI